MMEYKVNDYKEAKDWLKNTDAILITASNGLSIAEGYHIFADNGSFRRYFGKFRQKYGLDSLIRGVFTPMTAADHEEYMQTVHQYLIDDYHGSEVMKNLLSIVRNKPYFIVTSNGDAHFQMNGFDRDRIFEVEGNFEGLTEGSEEWNGQRQRFYAFLQEYSGQNALLFELGIGSRNQLIKAPTMGMAAKYPSWKFITMNMPGEINVPDALADRTVALTGDIGENLRNLLNE